MPISPPVQITVPFATSGLKNAIPASTNNVTGNAGYDAGFGAINMTTKTAGGIPPFGQDFNGIFFDLTTAIRFLEAGGAFPYNSTFSTAVGGYPLGALVSRTDGAGLWRNTIANNTTDPEAFGAGWQPEDAGSAAVTMTNANVTLTALQAARTIITITGVLTANLQLIMPTYVKQWLIVNNCTGSFTITVKTAAGSGVPTAISSVTKVYGDGTNVVPNIDYGPHRMVVFGSGTTAWVCPPGVYFARAVIWGAGGTGAAGNGTTGGGGGGGGGYGEGWYPVVPGTSYNAVVGVSGTPPTTSGANGISGGLSSFGAFITAAGGAGGFGSAAGGFGGSGGTVTGATFYVTGNSGGSGGTGFGGAGGGAFGSTGGNASATFGGPAQGIGSGGSGGNAASAGNGVAANGSVKLEF